MKRHLFFAAAVAAQVAVLAAMGIPRARDVRDGIRVTLPVVPVDPDDLFRGEYVRLGYDISRRDLPNWEGPPAVAGQEVWVRLEPKGASWAATLSRASRGADKPGAVWLRGRREGSQLRPVYGLEEFYVRQGRGPGIERAVRSHAIYAEFAVAADGTGTLTALIVNGERIE
jgi:uncharacterized membrane-anchored protein